MHAIVFVGRVHDHMTWDNTKKRSHVVKHCVNRYHDDVINGNIFRVTGHLCGEATGPGEFPTQRPVTRSFDVFFDLRLNKRLRKQLWGWWFETLSCPLWRHCNMKMRSVWNQIMAECRLDGKLVLRNQRWPRSTASWQLLSLGHNTFNSLRSCDAYRYVPLSHYAIIGSNKLVAYWSLSHYLNQCWIMVGHLGPLLLTWFNFNPSMDK